MPYAYYTFDDTTDAAMRAAANTIAASSAFKPEETPYHVPIIGSLHSYSPEKIFEALSSIPATTVTGRFCGWELSTTQLRAKVELCDGATANGRYLQDKLPRGRPWRSHYVNLGSVAGIDAARHGEFLAAVATAFPMDRAVSFALARLDLRMAAQGDKPALSQQDADTKTKGEEANLMRTTLNPDAKIFHPVTKPASTDLAMKPRRRPKPSGKTVSPHMKWERKGKSSIDMLIKAGTGSTGTKPQRIVQIKKQPGSGRASTITKARSCAMQI